MSQPAQRQQRSRTDSRKGLARAAGSAFKRRRIEDVALELLKRDGSRFVWYGNPQLAQDIYRAAINPNGGSHPINEISAVMTALAKSKKWKLAGYINHLGRNYPLREPNT